MDDFFLNKFVLITGGSTGIGLSLAKQLASNGASIAIIARTKDTLDKAFHDLEKIHSNGSFIEAVSADVSNADEIREAIEHLIKTHGVPDILITCAGVTHPGEFLELADEIFHWNMDVNYYGTLNAIRAVAPGMVKRGSGIITAISSGAGYYNYYGYTAYGASKFAVTGLAEALRMELKPRGIQVSLVLPGDTDTPQLAYEKKYKPEITNMISSVGGLRTADQAAADIIKGIQKGKFIILPSNDIKLLYFLINLLGRKIFNTYFDWAVRKAFAKQADAKRQAKQPEK